MVLYVLLIVFGEVICFCGGFIFEFMLGYVKLKYEVNLQMILCCLLDEDLQNLVDLVYCCCCIIMQNMCDEELVIVQVEEMQVVFVVFKGQFLWKKRCRNSGLNLNFCLFVVSSWVVVYIDIKKFCKKSCIGGFQ